MSPHLAFSSLFCKIKKEEYPKIIFTSGTLPDRELIEKLTGLEF